MNEPIAWLGLDGHAHFSVLGWMDDQGKRRGHWRFPTTQAQVLKHLERIPTKVKHLALEECGLSRWLAQVVRPHVSEVVVCDPGENHLISRHHHKCDEEDAYSLAHLYRLGALKPVWQPTSDGRAVFKCAAQGYLDAVKRQTALKLQLKAHFRQWGVIPTGSAVYSPSHRQQWLAQVHPTAVQAQLQLLYEMLDAALEVERKSRRLMVQMGREFPEIARLQTVPGVGRIGAHVFVAFIQEPGRFTTAQQVFRYCRLGIRDRTSDGKPLGYEQLDRRGHGLLKAISYRAWLTAVRQKSGPVYEFYTRSLARTGNQDHARLNTQRKILLTLWCLWRQGREFDPGRFLGTEPQPTTKASCG
jgi:transposase